MNAKPVATLAVALLIAGLAPEMAFAQNSANPGAGWTAWLGCWELLQDDTRATSTLVPGGAPRRPSQAVRDMRVCVLPDGPDAAVKMTTWAADRVVLEQRIVADGSHQALEEKDCRGWQRSEWAATRRYLFTHAELECNNQPRRVVSGVTLMGAGPTWVDIQALDVPGDPTVRVRRYERAADQSSLAGWPGLAERARSEAERLSAAPLTLDDVIQASSKIAPKAIEALLVETHATFNLNGRVLIRLQKAGVPANVTDLMVAQSFPERFVVERQASTGSFFSYSASSPYSAAFGSSYYSSPYGYSYDLYGYSPFGYSPYGYAAYGYSPYGYSPFAYLYWSQPYGSFPYYPLASPGGAGSTPAAEGEAGAGRAVAGRGYTRVRPRDGGDTAQGGQGTSSSDAGSSSTGSARSGTRSSGGSVSSGGYSRGDSSSGSSSSGGSSSGGSSSGGGSSSSGGSSSGGGRTAQPR